jgi:hypothetical protein
VLRSSVCGEIINLRSASFRCFEILRQSDVWRSLYFPLFEPLLFTCRKALYKCFAIAFVLSIWLDTMFVACDKTSASVSCGRSCCEYGDCCSTSSECNSVGIHYSVVFSLAPVPVLVAAIRSRLIKVAGGRSPALAFFRGTELYVPRVHNSMTKEVFLYSTI